MPPVDLDQFGYPFRRNFQAEFPQQVIENLLSPTGIETPLQIIPGRRRIQPPDHHMTGDGAKTAQYEIALVIQGVVHIHQKQAVFVEKADHAAYSLQNRS